MHFAFKRHQPVVLLRVPAEEDTEPWTDPPTTLVKGMRGTINVILPNGRYHVEIHDDVGKVVAYAAMDEDALEAAE